MHHPRGHSTFRGGSCTHQLSGQEGEDPLPLFWGGAGQSWMGIGGESHGQGRSGNTIPIPPRKPKRWFTGVVVGIWTGEGTPDQGRTLRLWKEGQEPPVPGPWQSMAAFGAWIEGPGVR